MYGDFDEDEFDDDDFDDGPSCSDCGCDLETENHDWDCSFAGDDEDNEDNEDE